MNLEGVRVVDLSQYLGGRLLGYDAATVERLCADGVLHASLEG